MKVFCFNGNGYGCGYRFGLKISKINRYGKEFVFGLGREILGGPNFRVRAFKLMCFGL